MISARRIGVLTGGGDVPGLNTVIRSVVYRATELGYEVLGIRRGWQGLTHARIGRSIDPAWLRRLDRGSTRSIDQSGGTILHTSRTNPALMAEAALPPFISATQRRRLATEGGMYDLTGLVLTNIEALGFSAVIVIGGEGTLGFARRLADLGVPLVAIPKTMDNDVPGTEYSVGFSSAVTRAKELITRQRTTLASHERIGVFRIFGRNAGFTALSAAYVTAARCVIPEAPFDLDRLVATLIEDRRADPNSYSLVIASEGARWLGLGSPGPGGAEVAEIAGKVDIGSLLARAIEARSGVDAIPIELTYDLRSGEADSLDQMVAISFANIAMDLVRDRATGRMVAVRNGHYAQIELPDPASGARRVDVSLAYNTERFRPSYANRLGEPLFVSGARA